MSERDGKSNAYSEWISYLGCDTEALVALCKHDQVFAL
jgi:hypothetical protein